MDVSVRLDASAVKWMGYVAYIVRASVDDWTKIANVNDDEYIRDCTVEFNIDNDEYVNIIMDAAQVEQVFHAIAEIEGL